MTCHPVAELTARMVNWLRGDYECYVARRDGRTLGNCMYRESPEYYYLRQLFVVRDYRRCGTATQLLDWMYAHVCTLISRGRMVGVGLGGSEQIRRSHSPVCSRNSAARAPLPLTPIDTRLRTPLGTSGDAFVTLSRRKVRTKHVQRPFEVRQAFTDLGAFPSCFGKARVDPVIEPTEPCDHGCGGGDTGSDDGAAMVLPVRCPRLRRRVRGLRHRWRTGGPRCCRGGWVGAG